MFKKIGKLFLCFVLLVGCSRNIELTKQTFTIELGKDVYANPALYVKDSETINTSKMNVQAISNGIRKKDNRFITGNMDYLVVGEYDFKVVDGNNEYPFKIKIKDTEPPTVLKAPAQISIPRETIIDWSNYFEASDLSGVSYTPSQNFSTAQPGTVDLVLKISDRFGNAQEKNVRVVVQ